MSSRLRLSMYQTSPASRLTMRFPTRRTMVYGAPEYASARSMASASRASSTGFMR